MHRTPLLALAASWATVAPSQNVLPAKEIAAVVDEVSSLIKRNYVFPDKSEGIMRRLSDAHASGRYAGADEQKLAQLLTDDLSAASRDKHMEIEFNPDRAQGIIRERASNAPEDNEYWRRRLVKTNHGITELRILPGNVRYMNISQLLWDAATTPRMYDEAARFLREGDAYIIDIRGSPGGTAEAGDYLVSYFMAPGKPLIESRSTVMGNSQPRSVAVPGGPLPKRPFYLLTSVNTASAAEAVASNVKNFQLAKIVGETTAGAGNRADKFPIRGKFVLSVSVGTAIHPVSGKGWEGTGIDPDIPVFRAEALDRAHLEALQLILKTASDQERVELQWVLDGLRGRLERPDLTAEQLRSYAGNYEGDRIVTARNGRLYTRAGQGREWELIPLGNDLFGYIGTDGTRIRFRRQGGSITGLLQLWPGEQQERRRVPSM